MAKTYKQLLKETLELLRKQLPLRSTYMVDFNLEEVFGHTLEELKENIEIFLHNNFITKELKEEDFIKMITYEYYEDIESYEISNKYLVEAYNNLRDIFK